MSIGTWDPTGTAAAESGDIEPAILERLAAYSRAQQLEQLDELISPQDSQRMAALMHIDHERWHAAAAQLEDKQIIHLIRFFAMAENLPGWEAGDKSPVIPLAKVLRKRGYKLDRDLLLWLRQVNDNRFLPYGPL